MSVADDLFAAIEKGDLDAVRACSVPEARIWHNYDGVEQTLDENMQVLGWLVSTFPTRSYDEVRRHEFDGGFVQQHVLRLTKADGTVVPLPACMVVAVADGKITRIDEYLDSAHAAALAG
jgi:ketosteroid isomerase-like protein